MKNIVKFMLFTLPILLILSCWEETAGPDQNESEPVTIYVSAVKDTLGTNFLIKIDSTIIPETPKDLFVKTPDIDKIDSIGAFYYTGQSLDVGDRIIIGCDTISDSIINIGALTFPNTGNYKVFYFAKITDSANITLVDTVNFFVGGVAPKITANDSSDTIFTVKELNKLQIQFKAIGQYTTSKPYFVSISDIPSGATLDTITGLFSYTPDTSIAIKDSSFTFTNILITAADNSNPPVLATYSFGIVVTDSTKEQMVIIDSISPVITISGNNPDTLYVHESYTFPAVAANDNIEGDISVKVITIGSVDSSILGEQFLYYSVSDTSGNSAYDTLTVNVIDTTPPVITLEGLNPDTVLLGGGAYSDPGATAQDNADGMITFEKFVVSGAVNKDSLGTYSRTYNVSDASGNAATVVTRTVIVVDAPDSSAPIITINGGNKFDTVWVNDSYTLPKATASDNKDGNITTITITPSLASTASSGIYKFVYSATDLAGNTGYDTLTLIVQADTIAPVITIFGKDKDTINVGDSYNLAGAIAIDNKDDTVDVTVEGIFDTTEAGSYEILYIASDLAGNIDSSIFTLTIKDISPAILSVSNDTALDIDNSHTLSIVATGSNLIYQWEKDGVDIENADSSSYTISEILKSDSSAIYTCQVSNSADTITSSEMKVRPIWVKEVSAAYNHSLILKSDSTLWAFGRCDWGQIGIDIMETDTPMYVMDSVIEICAFGDYMDYNENYSIIIKTDNSVWATRNIRMVLGLSSPSKLFEPILNDVKKVSGGLGFFVYEKVDNTLWGIGYNSYGQLGDSTNNFTQISVQVKTSGSFNQISVGYDHTMFLRDDGTLWGTGGNGKGQLGTGDTIGIIKPIYITGNVKKVASGRNFTYVLFSNNELKSMGTNDFGELGLNNNYVRYLPTFVTTDVKDIFTSGISSHALILKNDGTLWGTGLNEKGQIGDGTTITTSTLTKVKIDEKISTAATGQYHSLIVTESGKLYTTSRESDPYQITF